MKAFTPIILIVIAAGLFFWQVQPLYGVIQEMRVQSTEYDGALQIAEEIETLRGELADTLASFSPEDSVKLETFLPTYVDNIRTVLDVSGIAAKYGIAIKDTKTGETAQEANGSGSLYSTASLSFNFSTSYTNAINFLRDIESSLRLMDIASLDIKQSATAKSGYDFSVTLHTYWIPRK